MVIHEQGESVNRHIFTGKELDKNSGLIYFGARYYDPETARFTTQDSYLGKQDEPPSLHRYLYAYSNPTVYVDLEGNESVREWEWKNLPEKSFAEKYLGWDHTKDIYRGVVHGTPVRNYGVESARTDAVMDAIYTTGTTVAETVGIAKAVPVAGRALTKIPGAKSVIEWSGKAAEYTAGVGSQISEVMPEVVKSSREQLLKQRQSLLERLETLPIK